MWRYTEEGRRGERRLEENYGQKDDVRRKRERKEMLGGKRGVYDDVGRRGREDGCSDENVGRSRERRND